jgi:hypothetical protein
MLSNEHKSIISKQGPRFFTSLVTWDSSTRSWWSYEIIAKFDDWCLAFIQQKGKL